MSYYPSPLKKNTGNKNQSVNSFKLKIMMCIPVNIPQEICEIDDERKAIYHSRDTVCIWVFKTREERNLFMDKTMGMDKKEREAYYSNHFA